MKGSKMLAAVVVLMMVLSMVVVLNKFNIIEQASAIGTGTPGVDDFGNATTTNLVYNPDTFVTVVMNTTGMPAGTYYLYKPSYNCSSTGTHGATKMDWFEQVIGENTLEATLTVNTPGELKALSSKVKLDRAGLWVFSGSPPTIDGNDSTSFYSYFWVNTTQAYTITAPSDFKYGDTSSKTISVKEGDTAVACFIDLLDPEGNTVFHYYAAAPAGEYTFEVEDNITMAGDYIIRAYKDLDYLSSSYQYYYYDEADTTYTVPYAGYKGYHDMYGSFFTPALNNTLGNTDNNWNYSICGPWDPPEKNATVKTFTVETAKPIMILTNTTNIYWGDEVRIDVNVTDTSGAGINVSVTNVRMRNTTSGAYYYTGSGVGGAHDFTYIDINNTNNGNYSIHIPRINPGVNNYDWAILDNKTWYVYFSYDANSDGTDEWNSSTGTQNKITIKHTTPPVRLIITNDHSGNILDKKIDIPAYTPNSGVTQTIDIDFTIYGTSITDAGGRAYYGDDTTYEDWRNISITGDILYPVDGTTLVHTGTTGDWTASITPTKPGGTIIITINWPGSNNGSASQTINIVNGTTVTPSVSSFAIGEDITLSFTVKDMDGDAIKSAMVYMFFNGVATDLNSTTGDNTVGNGKNGEYAFLLTAADQGVTAPMNITIATKEQGTNYWGYTKVVMTKEHNMMVNATPTSAYAGDAVTFKIDVTLVGGGIPDEDSRGYLQVMIYDEDGDPVTDTDVVSGSWPYTNDATLEIEDIYLAGGTYTIYAYNDTHDSQGKNATITVTKYQVTSNPAVLAWLIDTETNITFEVTPHGSGTLYLQNVSDTVPPNGSYIGEEGQVQIEDGFGTLEEINATTLGNITYTYYPEGGDVRAAQGLLRITTATASPSPSTIYLGEPTIVTITVTHPATNAPLEDVRVGLDHGVNLSDSILAKLPTDDYTDANGQVSFSITAEASGDVMIYIANGTDPDNEFIITAAARKTMTISTDVSVSEGGTFVVEAKCNGVLITDATVTVVFGGSTETTTTGKVTLTAPSVPTSLDYKIDASAVGYSSASTTIKVLNVPKLIITIGQTANDKGEYTSPVVVTVSDDSGQLITGATVTFGLSYTTVNGQATITVTEQTTNVVTAAFTGFETATTGQTVINPAGMPGFELLTLIAAIGVAFILLRRRRK